MVPDALHNTKKERANLALISSYVVSSTLVAAVIRDSLGFSNISGRQPNVFEDVSNRESVRFLFSSLLLGV